MNILVLGATGYLGSGLVKALRHDNHTIYCAKRETSDISKFADMDLKWVDLQEDSIDSLFSDTSIDCVVNTICDYGRGTESQVVDANLKIPLMVLMLSARHGIGKFITMGTGLPDEFNMYSMTKKSLDSFGRFYAMKTSICYCSLELEMFYGLNEPKNRFLPGMIDKMLRGEDVNTTIGSQKRDIVWIEDVIYAIKHIAEAQMTGYHVIPVGTGVSPSISEIVDYIWELTGKKSIVKKGSVPMRPDEPDCVADTTKLCNICNWQPMDWKDGIRMLINNNLAEYEK